MNALNTKSFILILFQAAVCFGYLNVTFNDGMAEGDVVEIVGSLSRRLRPFLVELGPNVDGSGSMYLRYSVQGVRQRFVYSTNYPNVGSKPKPIYKRISGLSRGGKFKIMLKFQNNHLSFEYNGEKIRETRITHPLRIVKMRGTYANGFIGKAKWHQYLCKSATPDCGRKILSSSIESGLCKPEIVGPLQRIVGGAPANAGEHPWQVSIRRIGERAGDHPHICGGVLIDSCWVLTAAHCFIEKSAKNYHVVRVGDYYNRDDSGAKSYRDYENSEEFRIKSIYKHSRFWTFPQSRFDIALILLRPKSGDTCARFSRFVQPICLPSSSTQINSAQECVITGWGATKFGQSKDKFPACLQQAGVILIDNARCKQDYPDTTTAGPLILDSMQCAEAESGNGRADSCQGDSGGPLTCTPNSGTQANRAVVWGITSFGNECGKFYGVYTKVASFLDWIEESMLKICQFSAINSS